MSGMPPVELSDVVVVVELLLRGGSRCCWIQSTILRRRVNRLFVVLVPVPVLAPPPLLSDVAAVDDFLRPLLRGEPLRGIVSWSFLEVDERTEPSVCVLSRTPPDSIQEPVLPPVLFLSRLPVLLLDDDDGIIRSMNAIY